MAAQNLSNLAYVIYTSGSTGKPKGVMIEHSNIIGLLSATKDKFVFGSSDSWMLFHSISFDFSVWELWGALTNAAKLVIVSYIDSRTPERVYELVKEHGVTVLNQTPSAFKLFSETALSKSHSLNLRYVIFGGEALQLSQLSAWSKIYNLNKTKLVNMYGITETTVHVTWHQISQEDVAANSSCIGKPLPGLYGVILSSDGQIVPTGAVGQLHICGYGVARGYLENPALTSDRFISDPAYSEGKLYKTGDLVRRDTQGNLYYIGRDDEQTNIRGFRVELNEINKYVQSYPAIVDSFVCKALDELGRETLVAYFTAIDEVIVSELLSHLESKLPIHMVPSLYIKVPQFTYTLNGKIDKKRLPTASAENSLQAEYVAPSTALEKDICAVLSEALKVSRVSVTDSFFNLGGDSMKAIQVVAKLKTLGFELKLIDLYTEKSPQNIAKKLKHAQQTESTEYTALSLLNSEICSIIPAYVEDAYPLSNIQSGMLLHSQLSENVELYHDVFAVDVELEFNESTFLLILRKLTEKHHILRTYFQTVQNEIVQLVLKEVASLPVKLHDLTELDTISYQQKADEVLATEKGMNLIDEETLPWRINVCLESAYRFKFILSVSHAILDGWSVSLFMHEILKNYYLQSKGQAIESTLLPNFMADLVRKELAVKYQAQSDEFWKNYLNGGEVSKLPLTQVDAGGNAERNQYRVKQFSSYSSQLVEAAKFINEPLANVLHSLLSRVLSLVSGDEDVIYNTVVNCRPELVNSDQGIGVFVSSVPIRVNTLVRSWQEIAAEVTTNLNKAIAYKNTPLAKIQKIAELKLDECLMNFVDFRQLNKLPEELGIGVSNAISHTSDNFNIVFQFERSVETNQILLTFSYNSALFTEEYIERLGGYFNRAAQSLCEDVNAQPKNAQLFSDTEAKYVLADSYQTERELDVLEIIEELTLERPDSIAVESGSRVITYAELQKQSDAVAAYLDSTVGKEKVIGLCMSRSINMVATILGILKSGTAFLPIDPSYPKDRIAMMVDSPSVGAVISDEQHLDIIGNKPVHAIEHILNEDLGSTDVLPNIGLEQLAYVIYTSGSTGKPKGVQISRGALSQHIQAINKVYGLNHRDRVLQFTKIGFDISIEQIFCALCAGAALVLPQQQAYTSSEFLEFIHQKELSVVNLPPQFAREIFQLSNEAVNTAKLKMLVLGGEVLHVDFVSFWRSTYPEIKLFNAYGPAETTITSTLFDCAQPHVSRTIPLGTSVGAGYLRVLSKHKDICPIDTIGELHIGGRRVGEGYLDDELLTHQRFIEDHFSISGAGRMYCTGDLVRMNRDGFIEFIGRKDDQLKIRGYRIEPVEVEEKLLLVDEITNALVTKSQEGNTLVAYLIKETTANIESQYLVRHLSKYLPKFMIPSRFVFVEKFPKTPNGKIDHGELYTMENATYSNQSRAPETTVELKLADIWQALLDADSITVADDFFFLGGDSLIAIRLVNQIASEFNIQVKLKDVFMFSGFSDQVRMIANYKNEHHFVQPTREARTQIRASDAQSRLWFVNQLESVGSLYNIPCILTLNGELHVDALKSALIKVIDRHESLRTVFNEQNGVPFQSVLPEPSEFSFELLDGTQLSDAEIDDVIKVELQKPYNLATDIMLRGVLIHRSKNEHMLVLTVHHIAADAWSISILINEVKSLYAALIRGEKSDLVPLNYQYTDYTKWQQDSLESGLYAKQLTYWKSKLKDIPALHSIPPTYKRPTERTYQGQVVKTFVSAAQHQQILEHTREFKVTLFMYLQTCFSLLLSRYSNREDIVVGAPVAGRNNANFEANIGLFLNAIVLRTHVDTTRSFKAQLAQNKEVILEAFDNQDISFESLVKEINPQRATNYSPIFQVFFSLQNVEQEELELEGLNISVQTPTLSESKFDLMLMIVEEEEGLSLNWHYSTELFDDSSVHRMADSYINLVDAVTSQPKKQLNCVEFINAPELSVISDQWACNETISPYSNIIESYHGYVASQPDAIAVEVGSNMYTYHDLDLRVHSIANALVNKGVSQGDVVGIYLDRSFDLVASMYAINLIGACFLSLDRKYPRDRLEFMVNDSQPKCIVIESNEDSWQEGDIAELSLKTQPNVPTNRSMLNVSDINYDNCDMYRVYTSGSTGVPKPVCVTQRQVALYCQASSETYYDKRQLVGAVFLSSHSFDMSVCCIQLPLMNGGKIAVIKPGNVEVDFINFITQAQEPLLVRMTPSFMNALLQLAGDKFKTDISHHVVLGGEAYPVGVLEQCKIAFPSAKHFNHYGLTEITVGSNCFDATDWHGSAVTVPIGSPLPGYKVFILDQYFNPCPIGVQGEIFIAGEGVVKGYASEVQESTQRFVQLEIMGRVERCYRTHDVASWNLDGAIEYIGRQDQQINLRGFRIESGEIEHQLEKLEPVAKAVVVKIDDANLLEQLVAVISFDKKVVDTNYEDPEKWFPHFEDALKEALPEFMVPSLFLSLDNIPYLPNGKTNRAAVIEFAKANISTQGTNSDAQPKTLLEEQVEAVWNKVLKRSESNVKDSFFSLGGNSLLAIMLCSQLKEAFGFEFPVKMLFQNPTIKDVAAWIEIIQLEQAQATLGDDEGFSEEFI
ncbi:non-ribosomal peptide synthetase [Pseudoalteromonas rhizosphaerae]|uniref:non-ribosomal peptide synthetase n=1 Tax=Pseudoalteromonas rhizosphaerae TaxID=2518973 RepID=UPI00384FFD9E